jgi:hypothetical protein
MSNKEPQNDEVTPSEFGIRFRHFSPHFPGGCENGNIEHKTRVRRMKKYSLLGSTFDIRHSTFAFCLSLFELFRV